MSDNQRIELPMELRTDERCSRLNKVIHWYWAEIKKLAAIRPKFAVGDRVRYLGRERDPRDDPPAGFIGTVAEPLDEDGHYYVRFDTPYECYGKSREFALLFESQLDALDKSQ